MGNGGSFFMAFAVLIPFVSALLTLLSQKGLKENSYKISLFFAYFHLFVSLMALLLFYMGFAKEILNTSLFALHPTTLGMVLTFFVSLVSLVIHQFSVKYMYDDPGYLRYFILLDLIVGDIYLLLSSGNILIFVVTWHLMGILLYFLLVHNFQKSQTLRYGFYTFFTHLLADIPLMFVVLLVYCYFHTLDIDRFLALALSSSEQISFGFFSFGVVPLIALLVIFAAMIKSAQFPFHLWLPFTLEGPTPVSALMHAGIVNAGAFLANRFAPIFVQGDIALHLALLVGLLTAIIGSTQMLIQQDIKKALAYSTMGQMGYMMLEIGAGAFALAIYHMMVHGVFKASLFLGSGGVIHEARLKENITNASLFDFFFKTPKGRYPSWREYLLFVLLLPASITFVIFWPLIDAHGFFGVVVFYYFAWVSAAQVVYTIYHQAPIKRIRAVLLATLGYTLGLLFYLYVEKTINFALYQDEEILNEIVHSAIWPDFFVHIGIFVATLLTLVGAFLLYRKLLHKSSPFLIFTEVHDFLYRIFSREFYIQDLSQKAAKKIVGFSRYINEKLRY